MSQTEFVHLHVHTDYSLLDGACSIYQKEKEKDDLVKLAHQYNMPAIAMTDHGVMGGAIDFYQTLNSNALKPIIGCEVYVSPTTYDDRDQNVPNIRGFHLILLAKNFEGYRNLCKLDSIANLSGMYYKPRIDKKLLSEYSNGLIGLSACLQGEIPNNLLKGKVKQAKEILQEYVGFFDKGDFYLELMDHGLEEQKIVNRELLSLSKEFNLPTVATNDAHYLKREHAKSHELLLCIQTNATINDEKRFKFSNDEFYFKSGDEMLEIFKETPDAISNTLEVAEKCNVKIPFVPEVNHYPVYEIKEDITEKEYLRNICLDNMKERYGFDPRKIESPDDSQKEILERMEYELNVIDNSKYCSYFLVVWDFLKYAYETKVPVGPGRGSGAGSIVAYLTHITDIDPLKYQLLFERFLNPERVSPPDFDIDFCERRRIEVIEYVRQKYGDASVAQIGTYGTLKAKAVIKDVGRALGYTFDQRNMITKLMPNDPKLTLLSSKKDNELKKLLEEQQWVNEIFEYSIPLEGLNRNMSIHAAGVIIGDQPLSNLVPLARGSNKEVITQFPAIPCETLGLLKMDFLGLRTLTIIQDAVDIIEEIRGTHIDISKISLEDENAFKLLNRGDTIAVFQLESGGMRELCKKFGVDRIEDIIALIALYRPGPMQFIGDFINRKSGKVTVEYDHPKMEPVLNETYGIMLYQEQIMQVVQVLAGFSLGGADILRRAIGKKKADVLAAQKKKFAEGCAKHNNIDEDKANKIWDKIEMFAGYGFNKSHSAAYAFLAYRTAYLKANYPVEFMTAVLTSEIKNAEKLSFVIKECKEMQINILAPDVNISNLNFTADKENIRFGLAAIKGVGEAASKVIIESREKDGKFKNLMDLAERVGNSLTSRVVESLIRTGAFDSFGYHRSQLLEIIPDVIIIAQQFAKDKEAGQGHLFDFFGTEDEVDAVKENINVPDIPELHEQEILQAEKELLGFYVSGHPLGEFAEEMKLYSSHSIVDLTSTPINNIGVRLGGIITDLQIKIIKRNGNKFCILNLEDLTGNIECVAFSQTYEEYKDLLEENKPVFIEGILNSREEGDPKKITIEKIVPLEYSSEQFTEEMHIHIHEASTRDDTLEKLKYILKDSSGSTSTVICVTCSGGEKAFIETGDEFNICTTKPLMRKIKSMLGEDSIRLKAGKNLPVPKVQSWKKKEVAV
ncbi:MAG TPA: DNA polymerase III subunit alpha [Victivallales bacterium]|nr:DNA polymerase III subunit alpha [Victivallales bacterium]